MTASFCVAINTAVTSSTSRKILKKQLKNRIILHPVNCSLTQISEDIWVSV
jgi:hypothetical protein